MGKAAGGMREGGRRKRQEGQGGALTCTGENLPALFLPPKAPRVLDTTATGALQARSPGQAAQGIWVGSVHPMGAGEPAPQEQLNTKGGSGAK